MSELKNMTPKAIKREIDDAGFTQAGLARDLNVTPQHIYKVINGIASSHRVRRHIAKAINKSVEEIWPETYQAKANPTKTGRPLSRGLYDCQAACA
jgi:lambda repressor-like predicted transcriptional regulator